MKHGSDEEKRELNEKQWDAIMMTEQIGMCRLTFVNYACSKCQNYGPYEFYY